MRALIQRVSRASVQITDDTHGTFEGIIKGEPARSIDQGLVVFLGVGEHDTQAQADVLWRKISRLRIFADEAGKTNLSLADVNGQALIVSQFTLYAQCRRGNRPSFTGAGAPDRAKELYRYFCQLALNELDGSEEAGAASRVAMGEFGANMTVSLDNDGPFTIWLDTDELCAGEGGKGARKSQGSDTFAIDDALGLSNGVVLADGEDYLDDVREMLSEFFDLEVPQHCSGTFIPETWYPQAELDNLPGEYSKKEGGRIIIALYDGVPAGVSTFSRLDSRKCEMKRLFIRPQFRGQNLGIALFDSSCAAARKDGYVWAYFMVEQCAEDAIRFYLDRGAEEVEHYHRRHPSTTVAFRYKL